MATAVAAETVEPVSGVTAPAHAGRVVAVDAARGVAVVGMLLVNDQGWGGAVLPGFQHAAWNGWTPADLVFPLFLFVVGASLHLVSERRPPSIARILRRGAALFGLGFAMNLLPAASLGEAHIMGVLQRIALVYVITALLVRRLSLRSQVVFAAGVLLGYWALVTQWPLTPTGSLPGLIDQAVLGTRHVYGNGGYDPEGLLSTMPAVVNALAGYWALRFVRSSALTAARLRRLALAGAAALVAGQLWGLAFPINKRLWTSSFSLLSIGAAVLVLAALLWWTDVRGHVVARPVLAMGSNALLVYVAAEELASLLAATGARHALWAALSTGLGGPIASLAYALALCALWAWAASALWRRRLFLRL